MDFQKISADKCNEQFIPLSADLAVGVRPTFKEVYLVNEEWILWLEQRPDEGGRTTALIRPWGRRELKGQELTLSPIDIRSRLHGYGGGALSFFVRNNDELILAWVNDKDGCLWTQSWSGLDQSGEKKKWLDSDGVKFRLTNKDDFFLGGGIIDIEKKLWIGILEDKSRDYLVSFSLESINQNPNFIYQAKDFIGYLALSPCSKYLTWIEWSNPFMPWDCSELKLAKINNFFQLTDVKSIAGNDKGGSNSISVFHPIWLQSGELVVAEDSSGWWNLMVTNRYQLESRSIEWERLWPIEAETAMPQWVLGMSSHAPLTNSILSIFCRSGIWKIGICYLNGKISELDQPFDDISYISAFNTRAVAIASSSVKECGLLEIDLNKNCFQHSSALNGFIAESEISVGETMWFRGSEGQSTHAWYYEPKQVVHSPPPLLVKTHSGPTGMASRGLNLGIQYWTTRGWAVLDVNYGGSTGFGREYRDRLKNKWGISDVADCELAVKELITLGKVDPDNIAIEGGSAGGFTTLACLCFSDIFSVGACRYAVSDLIGLQKDTHRFEAGYLDYLIGSYSINLNEYHSRSPLNNVHKINCPVIFFQGLKDKVVPPIQTEKIAKALRKKKLEVSVCLYPEEGHGFRDAQVKREVLRLTEEFFNKTLKI
tara:strand:+ start:4291 stop:6255 length:1965 start_codon:yes stop_codon:yes gene_type:complete